jgi:hypothetical protein
MLDITMERPSILIDCTMVAPNAAYIKDYANSGQAAELTTKRKVEYDSKHFDIADTTRASLVIFAVETSDGLSQESKNSANFWEGCLRRSRPFISSGSINKLQRFKRVERRILIYGG